MKNKMNLGVSKVKSVAKKVFLRKHRGGLADLVSNAGQCAFVVAMIVALIAAAPTFVDTAMGWVETSAQEIFNP